MRPLANPRLAEVVRDALEETIWAPALGRATEKFLGRCLRFLRSHPGTLTASAAAAYPDPTEPDLWTLGAVQGWWAEAASPAVQEAITASMEYAARERGGITAVSGLEGTSEYLSAVRDRLVYGQPVHGVTAPAEAFEAVRVELANAQALGWSRDELSKRIAEELKWTAPDREYWERQRANATAQLETYLDKMGPPGTAAREHARLNDPYVAALQKERTTAVKRLDADQSEWEARSKLIARTEATGAANFAAHRALLAEGAPRKEWLAANDARTRPEHAAANGQIVPTGDPFNLGGYQMMFPGDPGAPVELVANCRCTVVGVWDTEEEDDPPVAQPNLEDLDDDDLEARLMDASALGDYVTAERIGEILDGRFYYPDGTRVDLEDPFTPGTLNWFNGISEGEQDRFLTKVFPEGTYYEARESFVRAAWETANGSKAAAVLPSPRETRTLYSDWLEVEWVRAEEVTRGNMLSPRAKAKGVSVRQLWKVNATTARAWASPELREFWDLHGRVTYADFVAQMQGITETTSSLMRGRWQ